MHEGYRDFPISIPLLERLFRVAEKHAGQIAVTNANGSAISYKELFARAHYLAQELEAAGVEPGDRVALLYPRNSRFIEAMLATLIVGAIYVPLDTSHPQPRIDFIIDDAKAKLLLTEQGSKFRTSKKIRRIETDLVGGGVLSALTAPKHKADRTIYCIYTSGSTGRPKGVDVSERNLIALFVATNRIYDLSAPHVWTFFHSTAFDFSVWEIYGALLFGGRIVCVDTCTTLDAETFLDLLVREKVTFLNQTPSAFYRLLGGISQKSLPKWKDACLRWVVFGGEVLSFARLRPWLEFGPAGAQLVNMYGITETCVHASWHFVSREEILSENHSVIGRPLPGSTFNLLNEDLMPVAKGNAGEAWISGPQVTLGYWGRPELTADRFAAPAALSSVDNAYRSGDLMMERPDGAFCYLGRIDNQVNIRGFRIELEEVEAALMTLPGVVDACVAGTGDDDMGALIGFLAVSPGLSRQSSHWRCMLSGVGRLPDYMIPNHIVCLDSLPLTVNGKRDRKSLLASYHSSSSSQQHLSSRPTNRVDQLSLAIRQSWADVLGHAAFSDLDNFSDVGGTSLRAVKLFSLLVERGVVPSNAFSVVLIFENPTVAKLVQKLSIAEPVQKRPTLPDRDQQRSAALERARAVRAKTA